MAFSQEDCAMDCFENAGMMWAGEFFPSTSHERV